MQPILFIMQHLNENYIFFYYWGEYPLSKAIYHIHYVQRSHNCYFKQVSLDKICFFF